MFLYRMRQWAMVFLLRRCYNTRVDNRQCMCDVGDRMRTKEDNGQLADEYYAEGMQALAENRLEEAALLVENAKHLYKKLGNLEQYVKTLNLTGVIYAISGNESMAVDCYLDGLDCAIDNGLDHLLVFFYNNLGEKYQEYHKQEKALDYYLKTVEVLKNPICRREERYGIWCFVAYLNIVEAYCELGLYELACKYLELAEAIEEGDTGRMYQYTCLISECRLYWRMGRKEYVYAHLKELMESDKEKRNGPDYIQNMRELCSLFKEMKEYECWKSIIAAVDDYAKEQKSVHFELIQTELWMEYYKTIGDRNAYVEKCVEHAELYQEKKEITEKERAAAIDIKIELREKEAERKRAEEMSATDALTGVGNRYALEQEAGKLIRQADGKRITVGVLDVDCFKQHNDTYGHIQGDRCLKIIANILTDVIKETGHVYRFGGDEFVILFSDGTEGETERIAREIQARIERADIDNINSVVLPKITVSQGYASFVPDPLEDEDGLIEHADKALYYVKGHGKNGYHII